MRKRLELLAVLIGLSLLFLPALPAEEDGWVTVKTSSVQLTKGEYVSACLKMATVGGDAIAFPVKGGSIPIKVSQDKVLIDKELNGKIDFLAAQGERSKPITVDLEHSNGDKVKYTFIITKARGSWVLNRQCGVSAKIGGSEFLFLDDNNNGIYGEEGADGVYYDKKEFGLPMSYLVTTATGLFEISLTPSGKDLKYRPYSGQVGKVDMLKEWAGSKTPTTIIVRGQAAGTVHFDVAGKGGVTVPVGNYMLVSAELPSVTVKGGNGPSFNVTEGEMASVKWGHDLTVKASFTYDDFKKKLILNPMPKIYGADGIELIGKFLDDGIIKFLVVQTNANGQPMGKAAYWSQTVGGSGGG